MTEENGGFTNVQLVLALVYATEELAVDLYMANDCQMYEAMRKALLAVMRDGFPELIEQRHWRFVLFANRHLPSQYQDRQQLNKATLQ